MAQFKIISNVLIVTSTLKADEIKLMQTKIGTSATTLYEMYEDVEDIDDPVFTIYTSKEAQGAFDGRGIDFNTANAEGFAQATILLPPDTTDYKEYVANRLHHGILRLNKLEAKVATLSADLARTIAEVAEMITVE